jgi:hypothetical protein
MERKLAAQIAMVHTITMDPGLTSFRLQEKGGPMDTDGTYAIGGPEVVTQLMKNTFLDTVSWEGMRWLCLSLFTCTISVCINYDVMKGL